MFAFVLAFAARTRQNSSVPPVPQNRVTRFLLPLHMLVAVLFFAPYSEGQTPATAGATPAVLQGGAPAGSYALSDIDTVNLYNGNLNVTIPLYHVSGRGEARFSLVLPIERRWYVTSGSNGPQPTDTFWYAQLPNYAPGLLVIRETGDTPIQCNFSGFVINHMQRTLTRMTFIAADGTETEFRDQQFTEQPQPNSCTGGLSRGNAFVSTDGSAATFVSDSPILEPPLETNSNGIQTYPTGYLYWRNGVRYRVMNGLVTSIRDRNGNLVNFIYDVLTPNICHVTSIVDSLNRTITITYFNTASPRHDDITYKGFGGASRTVSVYSDLLSNRLRTGQSTKNYNQLFPELSGSSSFPYDRTVVSYVQLPDQRQYRLFYDSYGELARLVLPTGGAIEYDFGPGAPNGTNAIGTSPNQIIIRRLNERRVYPDGSTLERRTDYSSGYSGSSASDFSTTIIAVNFDSSGALLSRSAHVFQGSPLSVFAYTSPIGFYSWKEGRETQTQFYDTGGTKLLQTHDVSLYEPSFFWWTDSPDLAPPNNPQITSVSKRLETNQVSAINYNYDQFNNETDVYEYDYGQNSPGGLIRHTHTTFVTTYQNIDYTAPSGPHLRSLPLNVVVYQIAAESSTEAPISQTSYDYDIGGNLTDRSGIVGHDQSYTTGYFTRGNPIQVGRWLNTANQYLYTHFLYDIAGNMVFRQDPKGYDTTFEYADNFGAPNSDASSNTPPSELNGGSAYPFPTKITNALQQISLLQYDFYLGQVVDAQDPNGVVDSHYFNDPLDRPTQQIRAANTSAKTQSAVAYNDSVHTITTTSDQSVFGDNVLRTDLLYDGLGRTTENRLFESATGYIATRHQFDGLGRVAQVYNPYRSGDILAYTTTAFDGLDRPTSLTATDGSTTQISYAGNEKTVVDPGGSTRSTTFDAADRIIQVIEYLGDGSSFSTYYSWDALDDLTLVNQGSAQRTFTYDSLTRLTAASNPESGNITFGYDNNGNQTTKTDARPLTVTRYYDGLNRLVSETYSDNTTPNVTYSYDSPTVKNGVGRLAGISSSVSTSTVGQYDPLGHILQSAQATAGQTYVFGYMHSLAGSLLTETYPSGRVVTNSYDAANRALSVAGKTGSSTSTYVSSIQYAPHGAVQSEQLGNGLYEKTGFNSRLQPTQISLGTLNNSVSVLGLAYGYNTGSAKNNNGNVLSQTITVPGLSSLTQTYSYDGINRLTQAVELGSSQTWSQIYNYDRNGNRAVNSTSSYIPTPALTPQTLSSFTSSTNRWSGLIYDAVGNVTSDQIRAFGFDAENRQTTEFMTGMGTSTYAYDGSGHRIQKTSGSVSTVYVYDAFDRVSAEYSNQTQTASTTNFVTSDHLGSVRVVTDGVAATVSRHDFLPFGEEVGESIGGRIGVSGYGGSDKITQRFTGKERDSEDGLDYFLARYYSSSEGRFMAPDSKIIVTDLTDPQSWNRYAYVRNSPLVLVDQDGHSFASFLINSQKYNPLNFLYGHAVNDITQGIRGHDALAVASGATEVVRNTAGVIVGAAAVSAAAAAVPEVAASVPEITTEQAIKGAVGAGLNVGSSYLQSKIEGTHPSILQYGFSAATGAIGANLEGSGLIKAGYAGFTNILGQYAAREPINVTSAVISVVSDGTVSKLFSTPGLSIATELQRSITELIVGSTVEAPVQAINSGLKKQTAPTKKNTKK